MATSRFVGFVLLALLILACAGCGRDSGQDLHSAPAPAVLAEVPPEGLGAIPALSGLPEAKHQATQLGPGWTPIAPQETILTDHASLGPGDGLTLNAAGAMAYAVYGLAGFNGDAGPTSARITLSSVTGSYYIGFSDYVAGTWRYAGPFTNSATTSIPLPGHGSSSDYLSPSAFTSPNGTCYFIVATPAGGLLELTGVELGVQGGTIGPEWTSFVMIAGGATGCLVHWRPSASCTEPDFMGYLLERAPMYFGDFTPLGGVIKGEYYLDTGVALGVAYRYRIAAVDASGNQSLWTTSSGGTVAGDLVDPIPLLKLPRGPLHSPALVSLDLSESVDPEGVGISDYSFGFSVVPNTVSGPAPSCTLTLPPGCHIITGQVTTSDGRISTTTAYLKVYPTWQETPSIVAEPDPAATQARLIQMRAALQPGTPRPVIFGAENATRSCSLYYQTASGVFQGERLPLIDPVLATGEPVPFHQAVIVPVASGTMFQLAHFENGTATWIRPDVPIEGFTRVAAGVAPGNKLALFVAQNNGGQIDLTHFDLASADLVETVIVPNIVALSAIAAEYNSSSHCYDIVYSTAASTEWVRWDPVAASITASATLAPTPSSNLDLETQPGVGRPGLARFDAITGRWVYTELDAALAWIADELVDNSAANGVNGDLAYGDNGAAFMYFATAPGQSNLHERLGLATWAPRNTPAYATAGGTEVALMNLPGTDEFIAIDRLATSEVIGANLAPGPAETEIWDLPPFQCLLNNIQGAAGTVDTTPNGDEILHVMFSDTMLWNCQHYTSTNGGSVWISHPMTTYRDFDLGATNEGGVYATDNAPANHELQYWDPMANAFMLYTTAPGNTSYSFLGGGMASDDVAWISYDDVNTLTYTIGHFGVVPAVSASVTAPTPMWAGAADLAGFSTIYSMLTGGAMYDNASLMWGQAFDGTQNLISNSLVADTLEVYDVPAVRVKQVAECSYASTHATLGLSLPDMAIWTTYGPFLDAQRFDISLVNGNVATPLPLGSAIGQDDPRRTVSAACGAGWTAIALLATMDGGRSYMEWSNYGEWERLEIPPALAAACNPELIVGRDGNWHIVYWDWATDRVLCLSSL